VIKTKSRRVVDPPAARPDAVVSVAKEDAFAGGSRQKFTDSQLRWSKCKVRRDQSHRQKQKYEGENVMRGTAKIRSRMAALGVRTFLLAGTGVAALAAAAPTASAQEAETVVVSASRITASGFAAPTPTTVVSATDLQNTAQPSIYDAIVQLPSLQGSVGLTGSPNAGSSNGLNGLQSFSLRGLGAIRTLTLIDGQRVVPANVNGTTDAALFPQLLISRVDIVTGGASASWGSDAVGGVVNFVTEKNFIGIKGHVEAGMSNYGDDYSGLFQVAAGTSFAGGKGHIEVAAEYYNNNGVPGAPNIGPTFANGRCCNYHVGSLSYTQTTTPAGFPTTAIPQANVQNTTNAQYGLITGGPLKGIAFDASGQPRPFQFGSPCVGNTCLGGEQDGTGGVAGGVGASTLDATNRGNFYTRVSYDILPKVNVYGTFNFGSSLDSNNDRTMPKTGVTVQCGNAAGGANPFLPAALNAACVTNKITSFAMAIGGDNATAFNDVFHIKRVQRRYVLGATGNFDLLGADWSFDTYFQHGENNTSITFKGMPLVPRLNAAIDSIPGPNGTVLCRSAVAQAEGCIPINIFGGAPISAAAHDWVTSQGAPFQISNQRQEAFSAVFNSTPFKNWAGDVAVATGVEYREEAYNVRGDAYGNGVSAQSPLTAAEPADPLLNLTAGTNWRTGNFFNGRGNYHVYEAFVEFVVPLIDSQDWGKADLDLAGRGTVYSSSGYVNTWKLGFTWDTPLDGVRFRALQSRDVRAPNLGELYAAPQATAHTLIDRTLPVTAPPINGFDLSGGNPNLKPEAAQTTELGIVFSPSYLPGFHVSADYYRVAVKGEIGKLTDQQQIDLCQVQGNKSFCSTFSFAGAIGTPVFPHVDLIPFNLASATLEGVAYEASYSWGLEDWGVPGDFLIRALAENVGKYEINSGVPLAPIVEAAGSTVNLTSNNTAAPVSHWKLHLTQSWTWNDFNIHFAERYFSAGRVNPYAIVCQAPNCPAPTTQYPTTAYNATPDYLYVDIGASYKFLPGWQAYVQVNNVGDLMQKFVPGGVPDPIGRVYLMGVRFGM
jgi:outer membrane receptor protein involved in Fe transport